MTREEALEQLRLGPGINEDVSAEYNDAVEVAIEALEQEPCEDAVSRKAVDEIKELMTDINGDTVYAVRMSDIRQLPPVNPQPKMGQWIKHDTNYGIYYDCSRCSCVAQCTEVADSFIWKLSVYCPDCGAKMRTQLKRVVVKK